MTPFMATHPDNCDICRRLDACRRGRHPGLIAALDTGVAVLGDSQFFEGYSLLLCDTRATELDELPRDRRLRFLEEASQLAEAVRRVTAPRKMNVELLGNLVPHLHVHVFPRRDSDPDPLAPVWGQMPPTDRAAPHALDPARHAPLRQAIARELAAIRARDAAHELTETSSRAD